MALLCGGLSCGLGLLILVSEICRVKYAWGLSWDHGSVLAGRCVLAYPYCPPALGQAGGFCVAARTQQAAGVCECVCMFLYMGCVCICMWKCVHVYAYLYEYDVCACECVWVSVRVPVCI